MPDQDQHFMQFALSLAKKGGRAVSPNPMVGCVIVKKNKIIATGFHKKFGGDHAEIVALKKLKFKAVGATLYVTLEPCAHFGKTPPCVDAVIKSKVARVVIAMCDPNPKTNGKSIRQLKKAKIKVNVGVCEKESRELNKIFVTNIIKKRPYVIAKVAQTLDGKITLQKGKQVWITGKESRAYVQNLRSQVDAVLVGRGTVQIDDPLLNVRDVKKPQPKRVILDSKLSLKSSARIFKSPGGPVVLVTTLVPTHPRVLKFRALDATVLCTAPKKSQKSDLRLVLSRLYALGIASVLIEGGAKVFQSFFDSGLVDEWQFIIAPKMSKNKGLPAFSDPKIYQKLTCQHQEFLGNDLLVQAVKK